MRSETVGAPLDDKLLAYFPSCMLREGQRRKREGTSFTHTPSLPPGSLIPKHTPFRCPAPPAMNHANAVGMVSGHQMAKLMPRHLRGGGKFGLMRGGE